MAKNSHDVAFTSPFGTARYPHLDEEDPKYGKFKVGVILEVEDADAFEKKCIDVFKAAFPNKPLKNISTPLKETEDGIRYIMATSQYRPKVYSGSKKPLTDIGGGSKLRIAGVLHPYDKGANRGVTIYLNDVQVTKHVKRGDSGGALDSVADETDGDDEVEVTQDEADSIDI